MKYIVILGDGMADLPIESLGGATPLEAAATPNMDALAGMGEMGLVRTVPPGMKPGSGVANLAVLGYDPRKCYSGRSPLEALSVGVDMKDGDVIFRANLVTLTEGGRDEEKTILDHSSDEITTAEADELMDAVRAEFDTDEYSFHTGTAYRHILVWHGGRVVETEPPHDHLGSVIGDYLPHEPGLYRMMAGSYDILKGHPVNVRRAERGLNRANSLWFWGAGTKPALGSFTARTGLRGAMISAVDLLKGIAVGAGMRVINVDGADGTLHTNYEGKARAAVEALLQEGDDFVYIHVEAPDEMGHQGSAERKIQAIEYIDERLLGAVKRMMDDSGEPYRIMLLPDHPTPVAVRTHTSDPVPFVIYDRTHEKRRLGRYSEREAAESGVFVSDGASLMKEFIGVSEYGKHNI